MLLTLNVPTTDGKIALFSPFYPWNYGPTMQKQQEKKRPKLCCVWISTCSSYKLLYFLLICSCEIPQKKICGLWLDTPTIRLKAKICNSRLWQQYILSSFCRHWCLRLVTRHIGVKSQMKSHFNKYCHLNNFARFFQSFFTHISQV